MMNYKLIIMPLFVFSIVFAISSYSWLMIWMGMELNLISFIFILMRNKTIMNTESSMKYFMIQAIGSLIFLFSINMNMISYNEISWITALVPPLALILKAGMAPLHSWTPPVVSKFSPTSLFMFLTMQKLVPMVIIFSSWFSICTWIAFINIVVGSIGGIVQSSFYKMLIFSSINNIGWMFMSLMQSNLMFLMFFAVYTVMNYLVVKFIKLMKIKWMIQVKLNSFPQKLLFFSLMMSLSGLPPFMGFIPKWMVVKKIFFFMPVLAFVSIFMSVFTLFFYLKSTLSILIASSSSLKWSLSVHYNFNFFFLIVANSCSPILFIFLT
uniref:NADH-ubiquinone oxidoreductase chain 2 n=1 Tax=Bactericera cockerelli TaxID=290155 RepID=A0A166GKJ1_9HEMI|nr:NADH dehydrogenase subunit 2 [Bactericera cockerelli]ANA07524.1 NADH dehydrogenase subunit 2 [Bactericera cockerelli]